MAGKWITYCIEEIPMALDMCQDMKKGQNM
jgi:hypothetical protein